MTVARKDHANIVRMAHPKGGGRNRRKARSKAASASGTCGYLRYTRPVMPTYEYTCRSCGHTFDIVQAMSDESMTVCPECGGELRKVFAPPAISFRGSGFYATDHGKKSKKASEKPGEKSTDTAGARTDKPSETAGSKDAPKPAPEKKPAKSPEATS